MKYTPEEYYRAMQKITLLNDVFMSRVFDGEPELTEFVLKIILNRTFKVKSIKTQYAIKNLRGRDIRLDIYAESEDGKKVNIEIQRQDSGAIAKRARYNSSLIDANSLSTGEDFDALPETYVIFITERDVLKMNEPIYFIERTIVGKDKLFDDEAHIVYVNNSIRDDTPLGRLMHDFACADPDKMFYGVIADKIKTYKRPGKVDSEMDDVMYDFMDEIIDRVRRETTEQVRRETTEQVRRETTEQVRRENAEQVRLVTEQVHRATVLEQAFEFAKKSLTKGKMTIEDIAEICNLPLEKVQELAADMSIGKAQ